MTTLALWCVVAFGSLVFAKLDTDPDPSSPTCIQW